MKSGRIILAAILGGIALFIWGAISHMVLPLGEVGIRELPNEDAVVTALRGNVQEAGFYFFPGMGQEGANKTNEQRQAMMDKWTEKYRQGPLGILIYKPAGQEPLSPGQLLTELLSDIIAVLIAAFVFSKAVGNLPKLGTRVLFVALLGLLTGIVVDVSYWNWYGFPTSYMLAQLADQFIGFAIVGLIVSWRLKPAAA